MPSLALQQWLGIRTASLDEIANVHRGVVGPSPIRRATLLQINLAYTLLLSSEFQGFCRDLHTESAKAIARVLPSVDLKELMTGGLLLARKLDSGNPNPGNIGADFNRFRLSFWPRVDAAHPRNPRRKILLEQMNRWRNAIARNAFDPGMMKRGRPVLARNDVQRWRKACDGLARWFDRVMFLPLKAILGTSPW